MREAAREGEVNGGRDLCPAGDDVTSRSPLPLVFAALCPGAAQYPPRRARGC